MRWGTLLKDLKDKVGVPETTAELNVGDAVTAPPSSSPAPPSSSYAVSAQHDFTLLSPTRYYTSVLKCGDFRQMINRDD